jgi:predicted transcriptional regulator
MVSEFPRARVVDAVWSAGRDGRWHTPCLLTRRTALKNSKRQYRSRIQIAADILEIAKDGSRKTRIMYLGNLSFDLVQKYLDLLVRLGLIEVRGVSENSYVATEKGRRFLEDFYELREHSDIVNAKKRALEDRLASTV